MTMNLTQNTDGTADFTSSNNLKQTIVFDEIRGAYVPPHNYVQFFDDFLGDALDARWNGTAGGNAPAAAPAISIQEGGVVRLTSGDATGAFSDEGSCLAHELNWQAGNGGVFMEARVKINTSVADVCMNVGFTDTKAIEEPITLSGTTLTTNATDAAVFVFDTAATNDYFHCQGVKNNTDTALTLASGNVGPAADTWVRLGILLDSSGSAYFYIDGVLKASVANAVTTTVSLTPVVTVSPRTTTSKVVDVDYILVQSLRG